MEDDLNAVLAADEAAAVAILFIFFIPQRDLKNARVFDLRLKPLTAECVRLEGFDRPNLSELGNSFGGEIIDRSLILGHFITYILVHFIRNGLNVKSFSPFGHQLMHLFLFDHRFLFCSYFISL